jgi:hypothetical protein
MSENQAGVGRFGLGVVDQIGYVVESIDGSMPVYESLFGPFQVYEAALDGAIFRGKEIDCKLKIATNNAGPVEIELIEVLEGETPHSEHLRDHGEGPQHIRFRIQGIEEKIALLEAEGYRNIFFKRFSEDTAFSYLESPDAIGGKLVELLEMP